MSCRRAFEIDLAAFLLAPHDAAWDEFRAHYPLCADCSAEVAAWTAVHESLAQPHPSEATLLRWSDDPDALEATSRAALARHLEQCPSCRDELRALEGFAATMTGASIAAPASAAVAVARAAATSAAVQASAPRTLLARREGRRSEGSARARPPHPQRSPLRIVRRVVWHPALAYAALLIVLLLPTFRARFDDDAGRRTFAPLPPGGAPAPASAPVAKAAPEPAHEAVAQQAPADALQGMEAARAQPRADAAAERRARPLAALSDETAPGKAAERDLQKERPANAAKHAQQAVTAPAPPPALPAAGGAAGTNDARTERALERAAPAAKVAAAPSSAAEAGPAIALDSASSSATRRLVVTLPVASDGRALEIRVRTADSARELRETVRPSPGAREVAIGIPSAWLDAERYLVEVYANGELVTGGTVATR